MLEFRNYIDLPPHSPGAFDHADVHGESGRVFVAHTSTGTVEAIDGVRGVHLKTVQGCPEASGVLCAQNSGVVFAASRGAGKILIIDPRELAVLGEIVVGSKPNGMAWDGDRKQLLVADIEDYEARLIDVCSRAVVATAKLPGRPRWCVYTPNCEGFLVNIREPPSVVLLQEKTAKKTTIPISISGPHGLDLDKKENQYAFVACDGKAIVVLDTWSLSEVSTIPISGEPDVVWHNPVRERLYCAIGKPGLIEVIDTRELTVKEKVETEESAHTFAFDRVRQRLYAFLPQSCRVSVYEEM